MMATGTLYSSSKQNNMPVIRNYNNNKAIRFSLTAFCDPNYNSNRPFLLSYHPCRLPIQPKQHQHNHNR